MPCTRPNSTLVDAIGAQASDLSPLDLRGRLPSRTELAEHFPVPRDMIDWFFDHYFGLFWPFSDPRVMTSLYEDYRLPPALILAAGHDVARRGRGRGWSWSHGRREGEYACYEGTIQGFVNMGRVLRGEQGRAHNGLRLGSPNTSRQVEAERENRRALPAIACEAIQQKTPMKGGMKIHIQISSPI